MPAFWYKISLIGKCISKFYLWTLGSYLNEIAVRFSLENVHLKILHYKISAILFRPHCARSHWKPKVVKMPNLFSMAAPQVVPVFSVSVSFSVWSWSRWLSMRLWSSQCIRNDNHIWSEVDYWYRDLLVSLLLAWINFSTVKWPIKWDTLMLMWHHSNTASLLYSWIERKMHTRMCVPEIGICYSQGINKIVHPAEFGGSSIIYPYLSHYIWNQLLIRWWVVFFFWFFCFFFLETYEIPHDWLVICGDSYLLSRSDLPVLVWSPGLKYHYHWQKYMHILLALGKSD